MKESAFSYLFLGIFALAGLGCGIASGYMWYNRNITISEGEKVVGEVVSLRYSRSKNSTTVAPVIEFVTKSGTRETYYSSYYTNIDPYEVGDRVALWYRPSDPQSVALEDSGTFPIYLTLLFFFTHGGIGFGGLYWMLKKQRKRKWLEDNGLAIQATVTDIRHDMKKGYVLDCTWTDPVTYEQVVFTSEWLKNNPQRQYPVHGLVPVVIDPNNLKNYRVQVE